MTALCKIEFPYGTADKIKSDEFSPDDYELLRLAFPDLELPKDRKDITYLCTRICYATLDDISVATQMGLEVVVRAVKGLHYPGRRQIASLEEERRQILGDGSPRIQVHVPNNALYEVNDVTWLENVCTEELQRYLDLGWRILAVCPSNDSRRPDYILGRNKHASPNNHKED